MQRPRILVVDDEAPIRELVRGYLERGGFAARAGETVRSVGRAVARAAYRVKPFSPRELVARVRALLRRPRGAADVRATPAGFEIDESRRGRPVHGNTG